MRGRTRRGSGAAAIGWVASAVVLAMLTGCTAATEPVVAASVSPASPSRDATPEPGVAPTPTMPPEWCEPSDFPRASLEEADLPVPGEPVTLELDPCLTVKSLLGTYSWLEDQGIDADLIQGFQSVADVEPWTAPLADGSGRCLLIRANDPSGGFPTIGCDSASAPATVETTTANGVALRFMNENDAVVVEQLP